MKIQSKSTYFTLSVLLILAAGISLQQNFSITISALDTYPSNVIIFIGDGMGLEQIYFGQMVEFGTTDTSSILSFPYNTTVSTSNIDGTTTDSAASATAISTGVKTSNGRIATNWNAKMDLTTILEIAQLNGYATGLVATCHLTHATPAAFAAHDSSRGNYQEIAEDFLDMIFRYIEDAKHFFEKGDLVNAFAALNYAHGWLDAGARAKIFLVKDSRLFTVD